MEFRDSKPCKKVSMESGAVKYYPYERDKPKRGYNVFLVALVLIDIVLWDVH